MGFHTTVTFTLIRPSATFSLREKASDRARLANKEAPKGRHILAWGVSPGNGIRLSNKP